MKHSQRIRKVVTISAVTGLCSLLAFIVGMQSSGTLQTLEHTQAALLNGSTVSGDMDHNGSLTANDAILLLEFADGLTQPTSADIQTGDLDQDYALTTKDVLRLLGILSRQ